MAEGSLFCLLEFGVPSASSDGVSVGLASFDLGGRGREYFVVMRVVWG